MSTCTLTYGIKLLHLISYSEDGNANRHDLRLLIQMRWIPDLMSPAVKVVLVKLEVPTIDWAT